ncbi:MAG: hypothetical protein ACKOPT_10955 [Cyanobium sp.]
MFEHSRSKVVATIIGLASAAMSVNGSAVHACPTISIDDIISGAVTSCSVGDKTFDFNGLDADLAGGSLTITSNGPLYTLAFGGFSPNPVTATIAFTYTVDVIVGPEKIISAGASTGTVTPTLSLPDTSAELTYSNFVNNSPLPSFTNTITQTPGPLPILGAGAAFGFSRKLRKRIKQSA